MCILARVLHRVRFARFRHYTIDYNYTCACIARSQKVNFFLGSAQCKYMYLYFNSTQLPTLGYVHKYDTPCNWTRQICSIRLSKSDHDFECIKSWICIWKYSEWSRFLFLIVWIYDLHCAPLRRVDSVAGIRLGRRSLHIHFIVNKFF